MLLYPLFTTTYRYFGQLLNTKKFNTTNYVRTRCYQPKFFLAGKKLGLLYLVIV